MDDLGKYHLAGYHDQNYVTVDYSAFLIDRFTMIIGKKSPFNFEKVFQKYVSGLKKTPHTQISYCGKTGTTLPTKVGVF